MTELHSEPISELPGVSVVICCYNSASRLGETLQCLVQQEGTEDIPWEVIVVDNASTDQTVEAARAAWPANAPAPLRVLTESRPGKSFAQLLGFDAARHAILCVIDDDNRVAKDWIAKVTHRMMSDPDIGACGGKITADFESDPPPWWDEFAGCYAVGNQWHEEGDITRSKGWLYGAGMSIRRSAWTQLRKGGFHFYTVDRCGTAVTGGGDPELCNALRLADWKIWLDWSLELRHFIPRGRLNWNYVRRLYRAAGGSSLALCAYDVKRPVVLIDRLRMQWWWQALATLRQLLFHPGDLWAYAVLKREGDNTVLRVESWLGRLAEIMRLRSRYPKMLNEILNAKWRLPDHGKPEKTGDVLEAVAESRSEFKK